MLGKGQFLVKNDLQAEVEKTKVGYSEEKDLTQSPTYPAAGRF